jgi:hypothetical protein
MSSIPPPPKDNPMNDDYHMMNDGDGMMMGDGMMGDDMMDDMMEMGDGDSLALLPKPSFSWQHLAFTSKQMSARNNPSPGRPRSPESSGSDSELMTDLEGLNLKFTS